jgi:hypothetical protein
MKRRFFVPNFTAIAAIAAGSALAQPIADSVNDFSCVQGQNNWHYGYFVEPSGNFQEMAQCLPNDPWYGGEAWWVDPQQYRTSLRAEIGFPQGLPFVCEGPDDAHAVVRRWVSEIAGTVTITGTLENALGRTGHGFIGRILVDGRVIYLQFINEFPTDPVSVKYEVIATVGVGSLVDFETSPTLVSCDAHARFTATISRACPILETLRGVPQASAILQTLYRFRDFVMVRSSEGMEHVRLFYRHAPEMTSLLIGDSRLRREARALLVRLQPALRARLAGQQSSLTRAELSELTALLDAVSAKASPALRGQLRTFKENLRHGALLQRYGFGLAGPAGRTQK